MIGDMKISFPADLVRWLSSDSAFLPPLIFYLNNISRCEKILLNNELLTEYAGLSFSVFLFHVI